MKIAFLGSNDSWYLRDLQRAAMGDFELTALPFSELATSSDGTVYSNGQALTDFDAVLVRTMPPGSLEQVVFRMDALHKLERLGQLVVNSAKSLEYAIDKFVTTDLLQQAGLAVPKTLVVQTVDQAIEAFRTLGNDVVLKPIFGSEGRGIARLQDENIALRAFKLLTQAGAVLYLQEFIEHEGYDVRVFLCGDNILSMRRHNALDWRTNVSRGASAEPFTASDEQIQMARIAATALQVSLAGVDLLPAKNGITYAIEVNGVPGWRALQRATGVDVSRIVLEFLGKL
ncbi:MAG: RimK family alpha-L-glutamate ligase [Planctomycetales bacterium]|nr:RimK family alpha-L-glutamate ligase [Planctomycetales bacterium]